MSAQHTPGPWIADDNEGFSPWTIWSRMTPSGNGRPGPKVAQIVGDSAEADADALLIAAAPELLEALQPFAQFNSSEETITIIVRTSDVARARAAIAKATRSAA